MKKVGIVSFWRNNYGSALQTYATKHTLNKLGFQVDVLNERYQGIGKYRHYIIEKGKLCVLILKYRGFLKYHIKDLKSRKGGKSNLSPKSAEMIELFVQSKLQPHEYSYKHLSQYAREQDVVAVIAGSDQVWNCSRGYLSSYYFLKFVPNDKKIAFAPSFGISDIPDFLRKNLESSLNDFRRLSVREYQGQEIIKKITGRDATRLPDPTVLLDESKWRAFSSKCSVIKEKYILLHFIDEPNNIALDSIKKIAANTKLPIICFAYYHDTLENFSDVYFIDGSPEEYVKYIDMANVVLTDSFHTAMFSINLNTNFLAFDRQYHHISSQSSRLLTLLKLYDYEDHFIKEILNNNEFLELKMHNHSSAISLERGEALNYLEEEVGKYLEKKDRSSLLKSVKECTGCGICSLVCPQNAISPTFSKKGFYIPVIDTKVCINCKKCSSVCFHKFELKGDDFSPKAFISYNDNQQVRKLSASGGAFSAIALHVLNNEGVVCGATLNFDYDNVYAKHILIDRKDDLYKILGSKYVQSDCTEIFPKIKEMIQYDKLVLFGGTSCQVRALYNYLGEGRYDNLITVDLVCHGVPGIKLFQDYIFYLENKYSSHVVDFSFRSKKSGKIEYVETVTMQGKNGIFTVRISAEKSSYYKLFLLGESYRDICYDCEFASLDKPADITLGDYFELKDDYPHIYNIAQRDITDISCTIANNNKGYQFVKEVQNLCLIDADIKTVQKSHMQLCRPMRHSLLRDKIFEKYRVYGYKAIANYFIKENIVLFLPRLIKHKFIKR